MSEVIAKSLPQDKEDWMTKKWRPMMAIVYMAINLFDFIIGPILYNLLQYWNPGQAVGMWQPLTLQGGGLIHIAFGAILGISAWTRGQEKVEAIKNPPPPAPTMSANISAPADDEPPFDADETPAPTAPASDLRTIGDVNTLPAADAIPLVAPTNF